MICKNCEKFALFPKLHGCSNCPRFCDYKEQKWCDCCSALKNICGVCGKSLDTKQDNLNQDLSSQVDLVHPFYGSESKGCKTCGGGYRR